MKCPQCKDVALTMSERQGVEIDYCSQCRGVWLDRGELDKLIEKSAATAPVSQPVHQQQARSPGFADSNHYHHQSGYGKRKHKSWLSEIFD